MNTWVCSCWLHLHTLRQPRTYLTLSAGWIQSSWAESFICPQAVFGEKKEKSKIAYRLQSYFISTSNLDFFNDAGGVKEISFMRFKGSLFSCIRTRKKWMCKWNLGWFQTKLGLLWLLTRNCCIYFVAFLTGLTTAVPKDRGSQLIPHFTIVVMWQSTFGVFVPCYTQRTKIHI